MTRERRQRLFYIIVRNNIVLHECNLNTETDGSIYWLPDDEMESLAADVIAEIKEKCKAEQENTTTVILPGDRITAFGYRFTVETVLFQDWYGEKDGFDVEFTDTKGNYHHWKQNQDGGFRERWNGRKWMII